MAQRRTRQRRPFLVCKLDEYLTHAVVLLEVKGYAVRSLNVTQQGGNRVLVRFKVDPPPPGRGRDRWARVEVASTDKYDYSARKEDGSWGYYRHVHAERGFRSAEYAGTTPRLGPENMLAYLNELPWVTPEGE